MSTVNSKPFLVSSGGQRLSHTGTTNQEARTGRRTAVAAIPRGSVAADPRGRRALGGRIQSDGGSSAPKNGKIPEAARKRGTPTTLDAAGVTTSPGRRISTGRRLAVPNVATRRRTSVRRPTAQTVSRRGSTMKEVVEQQTKQQPNEASNRIQAERQQRSNRGHSLRLAGGIFGARTKTAQDLFRGVPTLPGHALCSDDDSARNRLWASSHSSEQDFVVSCPVSKVDWFVSHTWGRDRRDPMFRNSMECAGFKALEMKDFLEDIASEKQAARRLAGALSRLDELTMKFRTEPVVLWIDKFCVSPHILERRVVIERHMEHFVTNSDGFFVLLSSSYFQRLWCVYEWGCFVATHGVSTLDRIRVGLSWLCSSPKFQVPLLARDLEMLSVSSLKCSELNDQLYLRSTISAKYESVQAFHRMVQISALCSLAKSFAVLALDFCTAGHSELEEAWRVFNRHLGWRHGKFVLPWRSVAAKLGLPAVCSGLDSFWEQMERSMKMSAEAGKTDDGSDRFCVSAPPRSRLQTIANSAAQMHLAVLVRKARSAAVGAESVSGAALMSLSSAATAAKNAKVSNNSSSRGGTPAGGGTILAEGEEENGFGSESSGTEESRDDRCLTFESEAGW